ncbi:MAG: S41 family peptidase [Tissierella sp.]|nr:S41 family peptidase [Tissierella sp.]
MNKRQKTRFIIKIILIILLIIFAVERIYNMKDEFRVSALDASDYGITETHLPIWDKLYDFEYLYDVLEENYPFFKVNERLHNIDWLGNKRKYKRIIRNTKNDAEFLVAIDHILKDLNNGHVNVFDGQRYRRYFKNAYLYNSKFGDPWGSLRKIEILSNHHIMGRYNFFGDMDEIEHIKLYDDSALETKVLIDNELAYMEIKEMAEFDTAINDQIKIKDFLREISDYDKLIIDIRGNRGGYDSYWNYIVSLLIKEPISYNYYSFFKGDYRHSYNPYRISYLSKINKLEEGILDQFPEEVKTDFNFYRNYTVRINPWLTATNSSDYINFKGKVYLLVDNLVFSASENFASFAKDSGFATLVGETTGGDRVFEVIPFISLPKSRFVIRYSRELGINADGTINMETGTIPHIQVDPTPHEDFTKDQCIQAVIND